MKIKTLKDIVGASQKIMECFIGKKRAATFNLVVDHGEGTASNCAWTPACKVSPGQSFLAVEDYDKIMVLLLTHPRIKNLEYDEKDNVVSAWFSAPEIEEIQRIENPEIYEDFNRAEGG